MTFPGLGEALRLAAMPSSAAPTALDRDPCGPSASDGRPQPRCGPSLAVRALAVAVALGVAGALGGGLIGVRDERSAEATVNAISRGQAPATAASLRRASADARTASRLLLDRSPEITRAVLAVLERRPRTAYRLLDAVVRDEPYNVEALVALVFVARGVAPRRVPELMRALRRADPYAWRTLR
ncbi:hypothetical protein SAMN02745716_0125 [Thermoleophilum album]|uniref:HEAT repeat domain-containing protein n=1 Tax=Thermoleophilum album TaxID=29539 RepID=A0A1H6FHH6_THEAL|nr:hypothetical protein SAMN02745716_0125 [Thermoleophilum album]